MSYFKTPESPPLPAQETDFEESTIPAKLGAELDLNTSETDSDGEEDDVYMVDATTQQAENPLPKQINNFEQFEHPDSLPSTPDNPKTFTCNSNIRDPNYVTPMMDFSDPVRAPIDLINPFGANGALSSSDPIPMLIDRDAKVNQLSDSQEQKITDYIDEKLLLVQRGFVKYLSSKEESVNEGLTWIQLGSKLDESIEFIWYANSQIKGVPIIYHANVMIDDVLKNLFTEEFDHIKSVTDGVIKISTNNLLLNDKKSGVPQLVLPYKIDNSVYVSYLIRIMGDLIDYIVKYEPNTFEDWIILLRLTAKFDNILSIITDYSNKKGTNIVSTTEKVRIASIIQRTKIAIVELFDRFVRQLGLDGIEHYRKAIENFQVYVGEIYEGLIDRTSI